MKKMQNYLLVLPLVGAALFGACELLQSGLNSEMQKKLDDASGRISVNGAVWYYPGSADMDMRETPNAELALRISKKAAVIVPADPSKPNGLSGAFHVSYTNIVGKQSTASLPFKGGHFSEDYTTFYLNAAPLAEILNPGLNPTGTGILELTIAGFVNNEDGAQKGRPLPPFTKTIDIAPLFPTKTVYYSTREPGKERSIEIPLNAPVTLAPDADFIITPAANYPTDMYNAYFTLELSTDRRKILLVPTVELYQQEFDFSVTVTGILPPMSSRSTEFTAEVHITPSLVILDGIKDEIWNSAVYVSDPAGDAKSSIYAQPGNEIKGFYVLSDTDNLYVAFEFDAITNFWEEDRIAILIDRAGESAGDGTAEFATVSTIPKLANTVTLQNGEADVLFVHFPGRSVAKGNSILRAKKEILEEDLIGQPAKVMVSQYGWRNPNGPNFLEYRFALEDLKVRQWDNQNNILFQLQTGDTIRVFGAVVNHWDSDGSIHTTDLVPGGQLPDSQNVVFDFDNALEVTLGTGPSGTTPSPDLFVAPPAPIYITPTQIGSNGVRLEWGAHSSATSFKLYRSDAIDGVYTLVGTSLAANGADWTVEDGASYWYKVSGVNQGGEGPKSRASAKVTIGGSPLSIIDMTNGTLDSRFTDSVWASFVSDATDSLTPSSHTDGNNWDIKGLYVTNDASNLYVALDFGTTPPKAWGDCRMAILIDNTGDSSGDNDANVISLAANGAANQTTFAAGTSVEHAVSRIISDAWQLNKAANAFMTTNAATWATSGSILTPSPARNVIKIKLPLDTIGNPALETELRVFAAFSAGWTNGTAIVKDVIPRSAVTNEVTGTSDNERSLDIDMGNALLYTVK
ncbi:MAG: hypothetical protein LBD48_03150 [Treponema sp.]|nr:hypothetical protein [Treponema sp.]